MIYLDNAATTFRKPKSVIKAVSNALKHFGNSSRSSYKNSLDASKTICDCRTSLAKLFGIKNPKNIAFTCNSTEALNIAINGILDPNDHVITTCAEHNSVLRPLNYKEKNGIKLSFVSIDENCKLRYEEFENLIQENTKAIICTHASNLTGDLYDIKRIGKIAKKHGLIFVVDASQSAGVFPIDVEKFNIDILCFTGHKCLFGPQGTGGIYVSEDVDIRPFKYGGTGIKSYEKCQPDMMPTKLEAGTLNSHGIAGLLAGVNFIHKTKLKNIRKKEEKLLKTFYKGLKKIGGIKIYGDFSSFERCPIISINILDFDSNFISKILNEKYNIATRSGAHCAPLMHIALGTEKQGAVRFSMSYFNTLKEIKFTLKALKRLVKELKNSKS